MISLTINNLVEKLKWKYKTTEIESPSLKSKHCQNSSEPSQSSICKRKKAIQFLYLPILFWEKIKEGDKIHLS